MTTNPAKITALVAADLEPGETLLAAAKASPAGRAHQQILGTAGMSQLGIAGAVAGNRIGERWNEAGHSAREDAGIDTGPTMQVLAGLSDRRFLLWKVGGLRSRPQELLGSITRDDIDRIELGTTSLFGFTQPEIVVHTTTGASFGLAVAKIHRGDAEHLVATSA